MKKLTLLVLGVIAAVSFSGCLRDGETFDPAAQYELERPIIAQYATDSGFTDYHDVQGVRMYYRILNAGNPESYRYKAIPNTQVPGGYQMEFPKLKLRYSGKLLSSNTVVHKNQKDEGDEISMLNIPLAWAYALAPRQIRYDKDNNPIQQPIEVGGITSEGLKAGARIRIVSPSYLLYGNNSLGQIPANSPMYYEIEVVDIDEPDSN